MSSPSVTIPQSVLGAQAVVQALLRNGIDTAFYGPGLQDTIHRYDEQVSVENLVESAEIYAETAVKYLRSL